MGKIILLDEDTINKIAAGEVVDRPASVVKELVENSIDAEATSITIEVKEGGKSLISISDNGLGIMKDDLPHVFERHATSKIKDIDDLIKIRTLGFRGEAMSSIAAVADIELESQSGNDILGSNLLIKAGKIIENKDISSSIGTSIKVKNLFYNTPARLKFLKSDRTELNYISDTVEKIAFSNTHVAIKYIVDDKVIFHTPGNGDLLSVIQCIFGIKAAKMMLPVTYSNELLSIDGYIAKPEFSKGNSTYIIFSINNRMVRNNMLKEAVKTAYKSLLMNNRFPVAILNISIEPDKIDVNVHPTKAEVKFSDNKSIFNLIYYSLTQVLTSNETPYTESFKDKNSFGVKEIHNLNDVKYDTMNMLPAIEKALGVTEIFSKNANDGMLINKTEKRYVSSSGLIIGQIFNTYIIYQKDDTFMMIDQHAAHERIIYEELMIRSKQKNIDQQPLLMPIIIELTPKEKNLVEAGIDILNQLGFDIEFFGENSLAVRQVPIILGQPCSGAMISELLDTINEYRKDFSAIYGKTIIQMACKSAIKAGESLTNKEIEELITKLFNTEQPYTCPHGRPTVITLGKNEIEKKFKRII
ncbi:MAG: DNA mismatch repair endonuclease MutL [Lutispora sp.]|nr:DNA mismatch repair endonuclease MutL [Lutispora sp.]MDD4834193.1 DNA mismatch repair endonuclease MutL [Lutispora sp.]